MKTVFIDGGARTGESLNCFIKLHKTLLGTEIHFYECNPVHIPTLKKLQQTETNYNIYIHELALWDVCEEHDFFISCDKWGDQGSTLDNSKKEKLNPIPIKVQTITLSEILSQFDDDDFIIVKLDIEGAEYEVLKELLTSNQIDKIDELYVEFHDGFYDKDYGSLKKDLQLRLHWKDWEF